MGENKNPPTNAKGEFIRNGENAIPVILFLHRYSSILL
jgi:hypothetical protein